jgi:two-component system, LytTR family, response regulator
MIRTVIVDDEPLARDRIRSLLEVELDIEIVAECRNGREAVSAIQECAPDLVFLDIQMPEMDGFDVIAEIDPGKMPVIVFVTAYDQYAIQAFSVHALDYLLKPFDQRRFREAIGRARESLKDRATQAINERLLALLEEVESRRRIVSRFVVRTDGRIVFVRAKDVECIEATGNYMQLYVGKNVFTIRDTMAKLESKLDTSVFVRVHRSWIVNIEKIQELQSWFNGSYMVILQGGRKVHASRRFRKRIEELIGPES